MKDSPFRYHRPRGLIRLRDRSFDLCENNQLVSIEVLQRRVNQCALKVIREASEAGSLEKSNKVSFHSNRTRGEVKSTYSASLHLRSTRKYPRRN